MGASFYVAELSDGAHRHSAGPHEYHLYCAGDDCDRASARRWRGHLSHGVRKKQKARRYHRICRRNALRHPLDHLRPCRYADLLRGARHGNISSRGRSDACRHEPADNSAHDAGEPQDRSPELPRGRVRTWRGQVARGAHGGAPRLHRRRDHRLHPERRPHFRRIRRTALYRRLCPRAARNF